MRLERADGWVHDDELEEQCVNGHTYLALAGPTLLVINQFDYLFLDNYLTLKCCKLIKLMYDDYIDYF